MAVVTLISAGCAVEPPVERIVRVSTDTGTKVLRLKCFPHSDGRTWCEGYMR